MKNKNVKKQMIKKYGEGCMIEDADIRYIPDYLDDNLEWRSEEDNKLTFHHIKPLRENGETTEENGAVIRWNNHRWLENQPKEVQDQVNKELQEYKEFLKWKKSNQDREKLKIRLAQFKISQAGEFDISDTIEIPLEDNKVKEEREEER